MLLGETWATYSLNYPHYPLSLPSAALTLPATEGWRWIKNVPAQLEVLWYHCNVGIKSRNICRGICSQLWGHIKIWSCWETLIDFMTGKWSLFIVYDTNPQKAISPLFYNCNSLAQQMGQFMRGLFAEVISWPQSICMMQGPKQSSRACGPQRWAKPNCAAFIPLYGQQSNHR